MIKIKCCLLLLQCFLDDQGAADLVINLIINNHSARTFRETVLLGVSLLDGGNMALQVDQLC